ncbi:cell fate (sporulation/competence/biofilm development) regulator YmcA (YheA/YmcA/DUF963 family) [Streptohalobacillus salinus]|uniref:Cell fate (Sporulation/competence/biofilm development) regulator YmcA (YheA/YmcA/DUF963 family) n=1 Tax=Streptohalobacillus salinus TaxID=621096 RepID=A0A2V3WGG1_9BACI|nr:YlbF family regulator [Streptohalobacillus salinus]PXW92461.1 cell fate (sporulation/competence/biofilm development) regulator YmcA (YheA/YmcA/DUF963 family) [Streptohalobacillus salinus]
MAYSNEDVLNKATEVAKSLEELEEVQTFKALKARLDQNQKVKDKISAIKQLQKQAVNLQAYGKTNAVKALDVEIDQIQAEIDQLPIVEEFKSNQVVVNDILKQMIASIDHQVNRVPE